MTATSSSNSTHHVSDNDSGNYKIIEVRQDEWQTTRIHEAPLPAKLEPEQVLLKIDRFAITANNISYASSGGALGYWRFFPTEDGWGRIPAMGWADVIASEHPDVSVGERVWGFFPFGSHLLIKAGKIRPGQFADVSEHRDGLAPVYADFDRAAANPIYDPAREDQDSLLRGLFMTSWLVEDFLTVNDNFAAKSCLITSASSKTSIALAHCVKQRGQLTSVAVTSDRNKAFCESLGCYDQVITYDDIGSLDASERAVMVDMAGNAGVISTVHHHFGDNMVHSCRIGATHHDAMGPTSDLPGATPEFFFAPHHVQTRSAELGAQVLMAGLAKGFVDFRIFCDSWLKITTSRGPADAEAAYQRVLSGKADPATGEIVSLWGD